jgi:hypothetical protein
MQPEEKFNKTIQAQLSDSEFRSHLRQTSAEMNLKRIKARDLYGNY